uniref:Uncharacterized protein n=1 Tax=Strongyloides venezuelensis TaxID=75913 RepID=A0A0K0FT26_STRVS
MPEKAPPLSSARTGNSWRGVMPYDFIISNLKQNEQSPKKWKKEEIKIFDEEKAKSLLLNFVDNSVHTLNNNLNIDSDYQRFCQKLTNIQKKCIYD